MVELEITSVSDLLFKSSDPEIAMLAHFKPQKEEFIHQNKIFSFKI